MDRRAFLTGEKSIKSGLSADLSTPTVPPPSGGLAPYAGPWTQNEVIHLLKRTMFGAKKADIDYFKGRSFLQSVDEILNPTAPLPDPPIKDYAATANATKPDTNILIGTTWVNDLNSDGAVNENRMSSFRRWWIGAMVNQDRSIREKMALFWHNHFATETGIVANGIYLYNHHTYFRANCLGNFKAMTRAVTIDPAMLVFLNGQYNTVSAPDENYGRELQELFCCGKGPDSMYTESDVKAAARVLTGWRINGTTFNSYFDITKHDKGSKQFSAFYNNTLIAGRTDSKAGDAELDDLMNMIFGTQEVAKYLCRRLYRWFVYYDIDSTVEANIISPLADIMRNNNYDIKPVMDVLLKSEHFFNVLARGCQIKSPIDLVVGLVREFNLVFPDSKDYATNYGLYNYLFSWATNLQQQIGDPPDVSGWKAYYQEPQFYEIWINSDTLPKRNQFTDTMVVNGYTFNNYKLQVDGAEFCKLLSNPGDPNALINDLLAIIFRIDLSDASKAQLKKDILLGGQTSDYYWTDAWTVFINNPANATNTATIKNRLRDLLKYLLDLAEYQLA